MAFLIVSFIAGVLTVFAPCILPLLPVVLGSSTSGRSRWTPYIVVGSLASSIILFTYILKVSTAFITVPPEVWSYLSGGIITFFGLTLVFPTIWEHIPGLAMLSANSNTLMGTGFQKKSFWGDVLIGASLGPIFSTCSPTYFVILASVLPVSFALGTLYLLAYTLGLSLMLLLIGVIGEGLVRRMSSLADSRGVVKRVVGVLFLIIGMSIVFGYEKKLETAILNSGYFDITKVEQRLLQRTEDTPPAREDQSPADATQKGSGTQKPIAKKQGVPYVEIVKPAGFVNTDGITIGSLVGKKVILVDFLTYSCINCQRTFPYVNAWYEKYKSQGLEIIGIHTPEFAFEKNIDNVREAMKRFGIKNPVVLDNDYATWNAFENRYWPRKYLIDIYGNIVYDHIGEGGYEETEMKIKELLAERATVLDERMPEGKGLVSEALPRATIQTASPETYFGSARNKYLANGTAGVSGEQTFVLPKTYTQNALYLEGTWNILPEYAQSASDGRIVYRYTAKEVYIVADADMPADVALVQDGQPVSTSAGEDVTHGIVRIGESRLYKLIRNSEAGEHVLELRIKNKGVRFYAFTFG